MMNMYLVIVFNLKWKGVWHACLEERSPMCPAPYWRTPP